jgi:hypothetical protein
MITTIQDKEGHDRYQIRPHPKGLCFEIHEWQAEHKGVGKDKGRTFPACWVPLGKFPTTVGEALRIIAKRVAVVGEGDEVIAWLTEHSEYRDGCLDGWVASATQEP